MWVLFCGSSSDCEDVMNGGGNEVEAMFWDERDGGARLVLRIWE